MAQKLRLAQTVLQQAEQNLHKQFKTSKAQYDSSSHAVKFSVGCKLFVKTSQQGNISYKLAQQWQGPYICIGLLKHNNLLIKPLKGGKHKKVHKNNCKLATFRDQHLRINGPTTNTNPCVNSTRQKVKVPSYFQPSQFDNDPLSNTNEPDADDNYTDLPLNNTSETDSNDDITDHDESPTNENESDTSHSSEEPTPTGADKLTITYPDSDTTPITNLPLGSCLLYTSPSPRD